jgi:ankyrin repeat protein
MRLALVTAAAILSASSLLPAQTPAPSEVRDWRYLLTIHEITKADDDTRLKILVTDNPDRTKLADENGLTPVHIAAQAGALKSLRVLAGAKADLNPHDNKNRTPLSVAIAADFTNTVTTLLDLGADANKTAADDSKILFPPLTHAAAIGNTAIINALIKAKADVNVRGPDKSFPITTAAIHRRWDAVNVLLENNANPNAQNADGITALLLATETGNEKQVALLLEKGADPKITDKKGRAPLSVTESPTLWKMLIAKGADVNVVAGGSTPLQYFIAAGKLPLIQAWLEYKPDPMLPDKKGRTAKELARDVAADPSKSHDQNTTRRQIAELIETYQNKYHADQLAQETATTQPK